MTATTPIVYLALPHRDSRLTMGCSAAFFAHPTAGGCGLLRAEARSSLLCYGFNSLWAGALNARSTMGATHFAMIHDDIIPQPYWLDILLGEITRLRADVVSVVVPIKSTQGLTSTGLDDPQNPWHPRRLTITEIHQLPETFSAAETESPHAALLINTGLWIADLQAEWVERVTFRVKDRLVRGSEGYHAEVQSEDWIFSRDLHAWGARVYATRKVKVEHAGEYEYPNDIVWGHWQTDQNWVRP